MGTRIGKLFVLLNLALSLVLGGLAFALFVTGIDWSDNAAKAGKPDGETLVQRKQLQKDLAALGYKKLMTGEAKAEGAAASWEDARAALGAAEARRDAARPFYPERLRHLLSGATPDRPAQEVELARHLPVIDPKTGAPKMKDIEYNGKALVSRSNLLTDLGSRRGQWLAMTGKLASQYLEDAKATDKLVGNRDYDPADPRVARLNLKGADAGLIALIARDREKREGLEEEMRLVESQDVNTQIDAAAVNRSYESVEDRIRELEAYLKKRGVTFDAWQDKSKAVEKKD